MVLPRRRRVASDCENELVAAPGILCTTIGLRVPARLVETTARRMKLDRRTAAECSVG